ncbi:hypothetical protein D3C84_1156430 [compost metagenome]
MTPHETELIEHLEANFSELSGALVEETPGINPAHFKAHGLRITLWDVHAVDQALRPVDNPFAQATHQLDTSLVMVREPQLCHRNTGAG